MTWEAGLRRRVDARAATRLEQRVITSGAAAATGLKQRREAIGERAATGTVEAGEEEAAEKGAEAAGEGTARAAGAAGEGAVAAEEDAGAAVVAAGSREWYKLLPGGMTVEVRRAWQLLHVLPMLPTTYSPTTPQLLANYSQTTRTTRTTRTTNHYVLTTYHVLAQVYLRPTRSAGRGSCCPAPRRTALSSGFAPGSRAARCAAVSRTPTTLRRWTRSMAACALV